MGTGARGHGGTGRGGDERPSAKLDINLLDFSLWIAVRASPRGPSRQNRICITLDRDRSIARKIKKTSHIYSCH